MTTLPTIQEAVNFTAGYVNAMVWANSYFEDEDEHSTLTSADLPDEVRRELETAAYDFLEQPDAVRLIRSAKLLSSGYTFASAGHDFALTRNGHGAGFWDRGLGDVGVQLTEMAHAYGDSAILVNADGTFSVE